MREKVATGITGLDEMLGGGIPKGNTAVVMGSFGTGKTTFALQYIWEGLNNGEKVIFISLEEDETAIMENASTFGWDFKSKIESESLALVKLEPADAKNTITRVKSELPAFIESFGATRVVLDSVSLLNMLFHDESERRTQLFNLSQTVKSTGATLLFTAEVKPEHPSSSRDGLVEYTSDGVILLRYHEKEDGDVQLSMRVVKMRGTKHQRTVRPYEIGPQGLIVHAESQVF